MAHVYPAVGRCIYCADATAALTDEHIIPLSLGGNLILPKASCTACARIINREIETPVASQEWGAFRAKRAFPTRHKNKRKTHLKLRNADGSSRTVLIAEHSTPIPLYKFGEARILSGLGPGADDLRWTMEILTSHEEEMAMQKRFRDWDRMHRIKAQPYPFARLLAKIAHGYVTAEYGIDAFTPLGHDIIIGRSDDYFFTVGGSWDIPPPIAGGDHITNISLQFVGPSRALVRVDIRLFSATSTPNYHVIAGEIDLTRAEHARAFERHRLEGKIEV